MVDRCVLSSRDALVGIQDVEEVEITIDGFEVGPVAPGLERPGITAIGQDELFKFKHNQETVFFNETNNERDIL